MAEIACLGILVADLLGRPIDDLPQRGRLGLVENMTLHIGGCAANTGIDLARLGIDTAVLGKVGRDGLGDFIAQTLERDGIDTRGLVRDEVVNTSASMVLVGADGERTFLHYLGGNAEFRDTDVNWNVVDGAKIMHVAGALVMPAFDGEPMAQALEEAQRRGIITSLDTVWDATGKWMETLGPCLQYADYFMPSLSEAQAITGQTEPRDVARALQDAGAKTVALKLGEKGCYVVTPTGELTVPAFRIEAVDGTGSGDAFDAGFLCGILKGWDLEKTARFANAVGAMCVKALGATAGARSIEETEAFLLSHA
jgi:sugar/nucleoside kinase (ribokinase family)